MTFVQDQKSYIHDVKLLIQSLSWRNIYSSKHGLLIIDMYLKMVSIDNNVFLLKLNIFGEKMPVKRQ